MQFLPLPGKDILEKHFHYDPITGLLTHKQSSLKGRRAGTRTRGKCGQVNFQGKSYVTSRLIWMLMTGEDPGDLIVEHSDCNNRNDAWSNLRLATHKDNQHNKPPYSTNKTGTKGVYTRLVRGRLRYVASWIESGRRVSRNFDTLEEASAARIAATKRLHGEFFWKGKGVAPSLDADDACGNVAG
jgi:hypothetical protein